MTGCLICQAPPDPSIGYAMGMMGWVCSNQCRNKYNSLLKTVFQGEKPVEKTYIQRAVELIMNKAEAHRIEAGNLDNQSKARTIKAMELETLAQEVQRLVPDDL